ncbi:MAG: sigma-70 family RNA polymerase sigma factor [Bifidobacteriaceae bacterium]|jgi:RNA polymerase sigma-70 factor (ECF subfamily)|nr:sigma-70 family RNA polymerase sigma factor [Bifidobacteriaceae bacterium]
MAGSGEITIVPPAPIRVTSQAAPSAKAQAQFVELYTRQYPRVVGYAQRRTADRARAEDIAAEAFRIAWEHTRTVGVPNAAWLFVTARNVLANDSRAELRLAELGRKLAVEAALRPSGWEWDQAGERFYTALDALADDQRELLMAHYWDGLSTAECAALLGCSAGAVRVRLHRARAALRHHYQSGEGKA